MFFRRARLTRGVTSFSRIKRDAMHASNLSVIICGVHLDYLMTFPSTLPNPPRTQATTSAFTFTATANATATTAAV